MNKDVQYLSKKIKLEVNGQKHVCLVKPGETLADVLRTHLHLTGTKIGCNEAECGACTVVVNGEPVLSCVYPAERAQGKSILTIEGLTINGRLHPIQDAFIKHGAVQCGFCTPGQIMVAYALLQQNPHPGPEEIREALKATACRCAGYPSIEAAVIAASQAINELKPIPFPQITSSSFAGKLIGKYIIRPDADAKVTGKAIFTDDLTFNGMLFGAVKRAGVPHAIVEEIYTQEARDFHGVVSILTAEDIPGKNTHGLVVSDWPVLVGVGEKIRYVGDAIAIVAAKTQEIANTAVDLIRVSMKSLPAVVDPIVACQSEAPVLHGKSNLLKHIKVRKGSIEKGFSEAEIIMEHTFRTACQEHAFLEPECSIAVPVEGGRIEIYVGSQIPYADRNQVARVLGWSEQRIRIIGQFMGGGFGGKEDIAGQIHAALLANVTNHPVKLLFDRQESMIVHPKRHATQIRVKIGATKDGYLTAVETELFGDTGAYASLGEKVLTRATTHSTGPYAVPHVRADCYATYTNNPPAGAFRGFGVTQSAFAIESMMDMLASKLIMDPVKLRNKNALRIGSATNTGQVLDESVGLIECINQVDAEMHRIAAAQTPGFHPFESYTVPEKPNLKRAWGFAIAFKNTGLGGGAEDKSSAEVELFPDGFLEVRTSAAELGQGLVTILRMVIAEEFSVSPNKVRVLVMDTDLTPDGGPTTASRQTYVTGNAARLAAQSLRQAIEVHLAEKFDVPPSSIRFEEDYVIVDNHKFKLEKAAKELISSGLQPLAKYEYSAPETKPLGKGGDMHFAYSFASQAAYVEVNTDTGEVNVLRLISANDAGTTLNPLGLKGQIEGGAVMGLGTALYEEFIVEEGKVITDRLARYRIPSITQTPEITSLIIEHPTINGPYGAKGVGEIVSIPTAPAITNAIFNAVGVRIDTLPVDQEVLLYGIKNQLESVTKIKGYNQNQGTSVPRL